MGACTGIREHTTLTLEVRDTEGVNPEGSTCLFLAGEESFERAAWSGGRLTPYLNRRWWAFVGKVPVDCWDWESEAWSDPELATLREELDWVADFGWISTHMMENDEGESKITAIWELARPEHLDAIEDPPDKWTFRTGLLPMTGDELQLPHAPEWEMEIRWTVEPDDQEEW